MSLDACVFCNCYETGKVTAPPPQPELVYIDMATGQVSLRWDESGADRRLFFDWLASACDHGPLGQLISCRLGNLGLIAFLRGLFEQAPQRFPTLLSKVVYNGVHGGDTLSLADAEVLAAEMLAVHTLHCVDPSEESLLRSFETQMLDLIQAAMSVRKPIVF
jgi:hypothetical protein